MAIFSFNSIIGLLLTFSKVKRDGEVGLALQGGVPGGVPGGVRGEEHKASGGGEATGLLGKTAIVGSVIEHFESSDGMTTCNPVVEGLPGACVKLLPATSLVSI